MSSARSPASNGSVLELFGVLSAALSQVLLDKARNVRTAVAKKSAVTDEFRTFDMEAQFSAAVMSRSSQILRFFGVRALSDVAESAHP